MASTCAHLSVAPPSHGWCTTLGMSGPDRFHPSHECELGGSGGGEGGDGGHGGGGGAGGSDRNRSCGTLRHRHRYHEVQPLQRPGAHWFPKKPPGCCHGITAHSRGRSSYPEPYQRSSSDAVCRAILLQSRSVWTEWRPAAEHEGPWVRTTTRLSGMSAQRGAEIWSTRAYTEVGGYLWLARGAALEW